MDNEIESTFLYLKTSAYYNIYEVLRYLESITNAVDSGKTLREAVLDIWKQGQTETEFEKRAEVKTRLQYVGVIK